jgi:hypothetical protein
MGESARADERVVGSGRAGWLTMAAGSFGDQEGELPVGPGLCGSCVHASVKTTGKGTTYLRCTRAAWDDRLPKYPRLPVVSCVGFSAT